MGSKLVALIVTQTLPAGRSRTRFDARGEATTTVGPYDAVVPSIAGRAWITSFNRLVPDPTDPFQAGSVVGRAWEPEH